MTNLLLLIICLSLGGILQRIKGIPKDTHHALNAIIINVCLPALTLLYTTEIKFNMSQLLPVLMPYILYICSFLFFNGIAPIFNLDRSSIGALTITAGISSISFVGFPIFEILYGKAGVQIGILMSQAGSFVVCGTLGIITASYYSSSEPSIKKIITNIFTFPPFMAFCIAAIFNIAGFHFPAIIAETLQKLGSPFTVLALISVGFQINFKRENFTQTPLLLGLFFKLLLAPLIIFVLYLILLKENSWVGQMCVVAAGLGSMNTASIIAINHRLNPPLATMMIGISIPISILTSVCIHFLISN
ncbi:Auxin Efflux Carrier [Emticicia oligotrophica DSM 17448]|uniref:Auxin Efflux Carrier n=1 Tax=Emticicia oligotrophica (strain DSM 17448 / CIP 109782 / MTCC 6937 / GPTSA100-15) TaxID=929562 RepID=A0ABN4ASQ0_EMTOG|nr:MULTISPECIES: transporter [Emticicia]AFK04727.1 Auxin Efflux Carrier [Emticicia oligotrophica DSM 17448]